LRIHEDKPELKAITRDSARSRVGAINLVVLSILVLAKIAEQLQHPAKNGYRKQEHGNQEWANKQKGEEVSNEIARGICVGLDDRFWWRIWIERHEGTIAARCVATMCCL